MPNQIDVSKMTITKAEPPARYSRDGAAPNPMADHVRDAAIDGEWRKLPGLSTLENIVSIHPKTKAESKSSEAETVKRLLRRAATKLNKGIDTTTQPGEKAKTVDLYFKVRDRRAKKEAETASK